MAGPRVSIRLATDGKAQVQRDFADIADAGGAAAQRLRAKFESEMADVERRAERAARTWERLSVVSQSPLQQQIGRATGTGFGDPTGTARASAQALIKDLDRAEAEARQLIAAIDPLFAAQQRYASQVERINQLKIKGALDEQRYHQLLRHEEQLLEQATAAQARHAQMAGRARMGMQQLGFQLGDMATMFSLGARPAQILASQLGQTTQAIQMMGGEGNKFLQFLGGLWGIGLSVAAIALTPLIAKLFETGESVDDLVAKLKKEAEQSAKNEAASAAFAKTLDGVREATRKYEEALKGLENQGKSTAEQILQGARAKLADLEVTRQLTIETIRAARARNEAYNGSLAATDPRFKSEFTVAESRINALEATLPSLDETRARLQKIIDTAASFVAVERGSEDAVARIRRRYNELVESTRQRMLLEKKTREEIEQQTRALRDRERAEIEQEQKRQRKGPTAASIERTGGDAIQRAQMAAFFEEAARWRGTSEKSATLEQFLTQALGKPIDPEITAWCAAFVNAVLATQGVRGSGSLAARSFLTFGKDDTASPQKGDIVIVRSSGSPSGQHVGFLESIDAKGNVRVLGGNTGNKVGTGVFAAKDVLGIRRPPTPAEQATATETDEERLRKEAEAMEAATKAALALALAYLESGEAAAKAAAARATAAQAVKKETDADAAAQRQLAKDVADAAAEGAKNVAALQAETAARKAVNDNVEAGTIAARDANRALQDEAMLRPLLTLQAVAQGEALKVLTKVIDAYRKSLGDAHREEDRSATLGRIDGIRQQHQDTMVLLQREMQLVGASAQAREQTLRLLQLELQLRRDLIGATDEQIRQILAGAEAEELLRAKIEQVAGSVDELRQIGESTLDTIFDPRTWEDWGEAGKRIIDEIAQDLIRLALLNPLKNMLFGSNLPTIAGAFAGLLGGPAVLPGGLSDGSNALYGNLFPGNATGTEYFSGGLTWVGEFGKELVRLPRGSKITPAAESRRLAAANDAGIGSIVFNMPIDATGADAAGLARVEQQVAELRASLPGMVVGAWLDARQRNVIR